MACAWDSRNNLFANQFNVGADLAAATFILGKDSELTCTRTLYTTDFCKAVLTIENGGGRGGPSPRLAALYRLWDALTGNRGSVTIFDVAPLLGALADDEPVPPRARGVFSGGRRLPLRGEHRTVRRLGDGACGRVRAGRAAVCPALRGDGGGVRARKMMVRGRRS